MTETAATPAAGTTFTGADGKQYTVGPLTVNAMVAIQERFKFDGIEDVLDLEKLRVGKFENLRFLLHQVLLGYHPDLTEEETGRIINMHNLAQAQQAVLLAFAGMGGPAQEEGNA